MRVLKIVRSKLAPYKRKVLIGYHARKRTKEFSDYFLGSKDTPETVSYRIMIDGHAIEKGFTSPNPRYFGIQKIHSIIKSLEAYEANGWNKDYAYRFGVGVLCAYKDFYEANGWSDREEYELVRSFTSRRSSDVYPGVLVVQKPNNLKFFDYDGFLDSRHSVRSFSAKQISECDIKNAVSMAIKTPTACNRQMIKTYFVRNNEVKNKIIRFSRGMTLFDKNDANLIVVTYDRSAFRGEDEIMQGLFNAGLFSMNLVNALHSIGIGSCMLEYGIMPSEENENKAILGIPKNEKIAIVIAAGYYPNKCMVPKSLRKPVEEVLRIVE